MRKKAPYVAKIAGTRNNYYKVYIAESIWPKGRLVFCYNRCAKGEYEKCGLPEMSAGLSLQAAIGGFFTIEGLSTLYRQGRILEEAIPIAMEILL